MTEAVGIATAAPQFTWALDGRGAAAASEIRVTDGETEFWRGRGASLFDGVYAGPALEPGRVYDWQVRLVDAAGATVSDWTKPQKFVRGLPDEKAWGAAKWIGEDRDFTPRLGDGSFVVEFKPLKGRFVACVRCAPDATGGVTFAVGAAEGAKTNGWNKLEIVCRGSVAEAKLNGKAFARREGTPKDGTFAVWAEKDAEARMRSAAWHDAAGKRVLYDNYAGSMHLQQVFFRMDRDGRVLIVKERPYIHPGILPKNCPRFRKTFVCGKEIASAVASVTARGFHELWLNGMAADPRRTLAGAPMTNGGWLFETYDVTPLVRRGDNTVGLWLSPGYSDDYVNYGPRWLKPKQALLRLDIRYADGTCEAVVTDGSWEFTEESPVVKTSIYHGETIDRAKDDPDWCRPAGSRAAWRPVRVLGATVADGTGGVRLQPNDMPPIRRFDPRRPVRITEPKPGVFVADFGQNRAGVVEVRAKGPKGTRIRLRTSEILGKDGMIDPWTNSLAESTDEFVLSGTGEVETFLPRFTYHGFHYVEITGWPGKPTADDLTDWAVGADVEETSTFACSDKGLMWLHNAAYWSMRSNLMTFPSDCCMRNERVGCNMDSQAFEDAALQFFDLRRFYHGWLVMSGAGGPNPAWGGDATTLARRLWRYYGDRRILEERYPLMKTACRRVLAHSPTGIWKKGFGDWCAPNAGTWASFFNDVGITETSVFAEMLDSTAEAASALGLADEAETCRAAWRKTAEAFEREFRNAGTATYGDGSQTTFVLPLAFGLVPDRDRAAVTAKLMETIRLKDRTRFDTGIFGTRYIGDVLLDAGETDLFLDLFTQKEFPGFGYMAEQGGTTLWEQWPFKCSMDSHNHAMMSGAASCLYTHLAGIRPAKPGYAEILVKPTFPSRLDTLTATRQTPRGEVRVSWARRDGQVDLTVSVPPFTPAKLALPDGSVRAIDGTVSVRLPKDPADWKPSVRWRGYNVLSMFIKGGRPDVPEGKLRSLARFGFRKPQEFREGDFALLEKLGLNFARIPLDYRYWITDGDPDKIDESVFGIFDRLVEMGRKHGVHIQFNFHRAPGYTVANPKEKLDLWTDPEAQRLCAKHWAYFARRYRDVPNEALSFNLVNEPPSMDDEQYGRVAKILIAAIRREDPKRFIVSDGIGGEPCKALCGLPGVGQAMRGYAPESIRYQKSEVWPLLPDGPRGYFTTPRKKAWYAGPFTLADAPAANVEMRFGQFSGAATFRVSADGKEVKTFTLEPKQGDPNWTNVSYVARWNVTSGRYLGGETFALTRPAKELRIEMTEGDWAVVTELVLTSPEGKVSLGFDATWRDPGNFAQRFMGWRDVERFAAASGRTPRRYADPGREFMYRSQMRTWDEAIANGIWVMVGEFGVSSCTSQTTATAFLRDQVSLWNERDLGWAVWGGMGFLDCRRPGADGETLDGYSFNRKMYDLCK